MHKLLERQLRRHLGDPSRWTPGVEGLVAAIDETYRANDEDRLLIERSLDLSSHELLEANAELQRQVAERLQAEEFLRRSEEDLMRAMERLRETDRFRAQFVNSAAHELNTPITPIRLELALLRASMGGAATPDQRVSLDALDRNVARIEALVGDLLEAARFQGGGVRLLLEQRALRDLAQEAVESYRLAAREAGVALTADLACDAVLPLDPKRVGQVLGNLLSNALKFTPRGGGICVALREIDGEAVLSVRDTGRGIAPEDAPKLFQPFSQLRPGEGRGTGLGLHISRGIVEAHGGRMWAESEGEGKGSAFHAAFPRAVRQGVATSLNSR